MPATHRKGLLELRQPWDGHLALGWDWCACVTSDGCFSNLFFKISVVWALEVCRSQGRTEKSAGTGKHGTAFAKAAPPRPGFSAWRRQSSCRSPTPRPLPAGGRQAGLGAAAGSESGCPCPAAAPRHRAFRSVCRCLPPAAAHLTATRVCSRHTAWRLPDPARRLQAPRDPRRHRPAPERRAAGGRLGRAAAFTGGWAGQGTDPARPASARPLRGQSSCSTAFGNHLASSGAPTSGVLLSHFWQELLGFVFCWVACFYFFIFFPVDFRKAVSFPQSSRLGAALPGASWVPCSLPCLSLSLFCLFL